MADEEELYDEFGNYIGPELDSEDDDLSSDEESSGSENNSGDDDNASHASIASSLSQEGRALAIREDTDAEENEGTASSAIVLHEDKVHYPSAEAVYGDNVQTVTLDEDAMDLDTPIIEPVKTRHFSLVDDKSSFRTKKARGGKNIGHKTDLDGTNNDDEEEPAIVVDSDEDDIVSPSYLTLLLSNESPRYNPRRSVSIIGHLHSGKTCYMDTLIECTKYNSDAFGPRAALEAQHQQQGTVGGAYPRITDLLIAEQDRQLSTKSTPCTLPLSDSRGKTQLITCVDTPGHVNFHDEAVASLQITDSAMLVVDALEGVRIGTIMVLKAAIACGLPIVLLINKLDRLILELRLPPLDAYFKLRHIIEELNVLVYEHSSGRYGRNYFKPEGTSKQVGNVCFASSQHGWSFTCHQMALFYSDVYSESSDTEFYGLGSNHLSLHEFGNRLWGDIYVDRDTKKFCDRKQSTSRMKRTFVEFILEPIYKIYAACLGEKEEDTGDLLKSVGVYLTKEQLESSARVLIRCALKQFFGDPVGFVDMIMAHVPPPAIAAKAKIPRCYTGPLNSKIAKSMISCEARAPLMIHVTKLYAAPDGQSFSAFGRIYSGTVKPGDKVKILGEAYSPEDDEDLSFATIKNVTVPRGRKRTEVNMAKAGNWVMLDGIDATISKTATITNTEGKTVPEEDLHIFKPLKYPEAGGESVVKLAVEPLNPAELPKMVEGLRRVSKSYPMARTKVEESGEHVLYGTGELYMDCMMHDLRHVYSNIEVKVSDPVVAFRETAVETSSIKCFAETTNKRNKLTVISEPLDEGLAERLETGKIDINWDNKKLGRFFQTNYGWDILSARSVWAFGPSPFNGPNILLDDTLPSETPKDLLGNIKNSFVQGFQWATREGPLCEEPVRSTKIKILDSIIADKPIHRGGGQIIPAARRVVHSAFLTAVPRLMEPVYRLQITCPADIIPPLEPILSKRRGHIVSSGALAGSPLSVVKAFLPVMDSFGFETDVRTYTQGQAMVHSVFDHWAVVPGDPLDRNIVLHPLEPSPPMALAREFLVKTRRRKGLSEDVSITKFLDEGMRTRLMELEQDDEMAE